MGSGKGIEECNMTYNQSAVLMTVLFAAVLPAFFAMPWITIQAPSAMGLTGFNMASLATNPTTPILAIGMVLSALVGASIPNFMKRRRTLLRLYMGLTGLGCTSLMIFHVPGLYASFSWNFGYWATLYLFAGASFIATYMLGKISK